MKDHNCENNIESNMSPAHCRICKKRLNHDKVIEDRAEEICEALNQRGARLDKRDKEEIFQTLKDIYQKGREDEKYRIWKEVQPLLAKYSIDRPIPPSVIREFLGEFN